MLEKQMRVMHENLGQHEKEKAHFSSFKNSSLTHFIWKLYFFLVYHQCVVVKSEKLFYYNLNVSFKALGYPFILELTNKPNHVCLFYADTEYDEDCTYAFNIGFEDNIIPIWLDIA